MQQHNWGAKVVDQHAWPDELILQEVLARLTWYHNIAILEKISSPDERDIEKGLIDHIRNFLLELGAGFASVGSQYHLEVADEDFYIDLLFYHLKLRCYVVIELKKGKFKPEYAGKMNSLLNMLCEMSKPRSASQLSKSPKPCRTY